MTGKVPYCRCRRTTSICEKPSVATGKPQHSNVHFISSLDKRQSKRWGDDLHVSSRAISLRSAALFNIIVKCIGGCSYEMEPAVPVMSSQAGRKGGGKRRREGKNRIYMNGKLSFNKQAQYSKILRRSAIKPLIYFWGVSSLPHSRLYQHFHFSLFLGDYNLTLKTCLQWKVAHKPQPKRSFSLLSI